MRLIFLFAPEAGHRRALNWDAALPPLEVIRLRRRLQILGVMDVDDRVLAPGVIQDALLVVVLPASTWAMMPMLRCRKSGRTGMADSEAKGPASYISGLRSSNGARIVVD